MNECEGGCHENSGKHYGEPGPCFCPCHDDEDTVRCEVCGRHPAESTKPCEDCPGLAVVGGVIYVERAPFRED